MSSKDFATDPTHPLFGPRLKVERAKGHVKEIERCIAEFHARDPYTVLTEKDPETANEDYRLRVYRLRVNEPVPLTLSAPIGDCIHNLRAAFDLIACQIVSIGSDNITQAQFPVNGRRESFEAKGVAKINGAPKHAIDVVERLQPYHGGDNATLWNIHRLDILDKHRTIIPVGAAQRHFSDNPHAMLRQMGFKEIPDDLELPGLFFTTSKRQYPLEDGATLLTAKIATPDGEFRPHFKFTFDVAFGDGEVVDGEPVIPTLNQFVQFTKRAIEIFAREVFP